ncbi:MAG TPA: hypothetical protein VK897_08570 [Anaerolineales bacterium]|nr:hypothetical protein [Anaerolineales bacterium]
MQNRTFSARIASIFLIVHGLVEIAGLALITSIPLALISFGGLNGQALEHNASAVAMYGVFWGIGRFVAAWGSWSLRKWAVLLGIILSGVTMVAAVTIIPAGVTDTLFAVPALAFLLYTWFGSEQIDMQH